MNSKESKGWLISSIVLVALVILFVMTVSGCVTQITKVNSPECVDAKHYLIGDSICNIRDTENPQH